MAFGKQKQKAAFASAPLKAAAGSAAQIGQFYTYSVGSAEEQALSIPTVARSVQMIASVVGCLGLKHYTLQWTGEEYEEIYLELEQWMRQPDPKVTRNFIMSQTSTDLMLHGSAFWYVTSRSTATGRPLSFQWLPASMVTLEDQQGPQRFGPSEQAMFNGVNLNMENVLQFIAPTQAVNEIAAGYLQQTDASEPMSGEELAELAAAWSAARRSSAIGALNSVVTFKEFTSDPSKLQLVESRQFQALELSRQCGIPPYLLGIGVPGSFTYQNAQQARQDLYLFGAKQILTAIEETLSSSFCLPQNRFVKFDVEHYLYENSMADVEIEDTADIRIEEGTRR